MGYKRGSNCVEAIVSYIFENNCGLLAMMGCISIELHVVLARKSSAHEEALPCDSDAEFSEEEDLLRSTSAEYQAELPEGQLLRKYGLRLPDAAL